ncbi:MAG TPA: recombinase RecT [Micromonosporaceae bacterium]|nr:recombinase RecT [Micromonosporaceae bacterium]
MASDLRTRARKGAVARRDPAELRQQIRSMETQFQMAMPRGVEAGQLVRDAMTVLSANPRLADCDGRSVLGGLMTCAQLGLRPGVLGQAWLIPFKGKAQLVIGYQGLVMLAQRSGDIASISARIVHQRDHFDVEFGLDEKLVHKPAMGERGEPVGYYCVVKSTRGGVYWEFISKRDAEVHRDKFAMQRDYETGAVKGPWVEHFDSMALKTVVKMALKLAPRNTEIVTAMNVDESVRIDVTPTADLTDVHTAVIDPEDDEPAPDDPADGQPEVQDPPADAGWPEVKQPNSGGETP